MRPPRLTREQYTKIATDYFGEVRETSGSELIFLCPFHGDTSPSLWFNTEHGAWYCFACHERGSALGLTSRTPVVAESEEIAALREALDDLVPRACTCARDYAHGRARLMNNYVSSYELDDDEGRGTGEGRRRRDARPGVCEACSRPHVLDEDYLTTFASAKDRVFDYWCSTRRLTTETITTFGLGFDLLRRCATIPVRTHEGLLLGVIRRQMDRKPKYLNPKDFPKTTQLFGSHLLADSPAWVVLCEGPVDTMHVVQAGLPAVGMYGSSLSREQAGLLHYLGVQGVVVFTDAEDEGRDADRQACRRLAEMDFPVRSVQWGKRRHGDPGGLSAQVIRGMVQRSVWKNPL